MKVVFIARSTLFSSPGGDTVQVLSTAKYLRKINLDVDVKLTHEHIDYTYYDLMHFFNIIRPADILPHIKKSNLPFVVSTIYVDYEIFEKQARGGFYGVVAKLMDKNRIEYLKAIIRWVKNGEKIKSSYYLLYGHSKSIKYILSKSGLLLPNSESEYARLFRDFKLPKPYKVIPNAFDPDNFKENIIFKKVDLLLCVAQIEPRKNQLNLIRAVNNTKYTLLIIGKPAVNHKTYYDLCLKEAATNVKFLGYFEVSQLVRYYQEAAVHILPSWFETTGLSSLEAAAMGCNIVATKYGDAYDYFGENAFYCEPGNVQSILDAVKEAASSPINETFVKEIRTNYTWEITAQKTLDAYQVVLNKK